MCLRIGTMTNSVAAMISKIDCLIIALYSHKKITDLQDKLYGEMSKIEGLANEENI